VYDQAIPLEQAYLVGIGVKGTRPLLSLEESLDELTLLAETAGLEVVGISTQKVSRIDPKTFIGSGKVEEVKQELETCGAATVIFDDELTPRHQRELETAFGESIKILDRSALILDIFGQHARTHEGRLQVELAQYEYLLPRLTRQWTHLERQTGGGSARGGSGGVGLRGPGETQLEVDRREIGRKISRLKAELEQVRAHRGRHRQQRHKAGVPVVAMVGYTNAGKSTLMRRLTLADVYIADQLFATLDPTTRKIPLPSKKEAVLSDTVGFIQKLPTTLIAAFRATLEEIIEADLILHVVDSAHEQALAHIETVEDTLAELDIPPLPQILVLNKTDLWASPQQMAKFQDLGYDDIVSISAQHGTGIESLLESAEKAIQSTMQLVEVRLTYQQGELLGIIHRQGIVEEESHDGQGVTIRAHVPKRLADHLAEYHSRKAPLT
jgi:GTP-binding protein HflX